MHLPSPVNPDVNVIADQVKEGYAVATQLLAAVQYRLGELAGTARLDPEESLRLQEVLVGIWEVLYAGVLCALHDYGSELTSWDETDNTYSDGRLVTNTIRIEPTEESDDCWRHNGFTIGDGAVGEVFLGEIASIAPAPMKFSVGRVVGMDDEPARDQLGQQHYYENLLDAASRLREGGISLRPRGLGG